MGTANSVGEGQLIAGKYRLTSLIGRGGMGSVWRAEHLALKSPVALKLIDPSLDESTDAISRFTREAQSAAKLRSPHVVQILDHGVDEGRPYMVMELMEGETLGDRLDRVGKLSSVETLRILSHVARAMTRAHEAGIVHRDLKPANIFIVHNDDDEIAKVLDFGIVKKTSLSDLDTATSETRTGSLLGTPYYMSPEQAQGDRDLDGRSDLWAMGVITFECLLGVRPFVSDAIGELVLKICVRPPPVPSEVGRVPTGFDGWFARACASLPADRFQSAREMVEAFRRTGELMGVAVSETEPAPPAVTGVTVPDIPRAPALPAVTGGGAITFSTTSRHPPPKSRRSMMVAAGVALAALGALALWFAGKSGTQTVALAASAPLVASEAPAPPSAKPSVPSVEPALANDLAQTVPAPSAVAAPRSSASRAIGGGRLAPAASGKPGVKPVPPGQSKVDLGI